MDGCPCGSRSTAIPTRETQPWSSGGRDGCRRGVWPSARWFRKSRRNESLPPRLRRPLHQLTRFLRPSYILSFMAEPVRKLPADRKPEPSPSEDSFRYGTRYRTVLLPNGETDIEEIPLTVEDLLYPQLGDHVTQSDQHVEWFLRLGYLLKRYYESRQDVLVCADLKMLWGIPGLKCPSPDIG